MQNNPDAPKIFQNSERSSFKKLFLESDQQHKNTFLLFPKQANFYGKDTGEEIVLIVRSHWIAYLPDIFLAFIVVLIPVILLLMSFASVFLGSPILYVGMLVIAFAIGVNIVTNAIARWYYTVNIITTQRIVAINMMNAFSHSYTEAQLEHIEDVTHTHLGYLETLFDVGNIDVDTAGHEVDFKLHFIPRPRDVQDVLNDLLEMKQKGEI